MSKLQLPSVTLVCVDCVDVDRAIRVIERCKAQVDFAEVKLLTSLTTDYPHKVECQHLPSLIHYSIFCLKKLYQFVSTQHMLIVQRDGWILNPKTWNNAWLQYDYIGPLFNDYDVNGAGGFSFRSRALMEAVSAMLPNWEESDEGTERLQKSVGCWEDGAISMTLKARLEKQGFKYPTLQIASMFAQGGNPNNEYYYPYPFGFHGSWRMIHQETGWVEPTLKHDGYIPLPIWTK